MMINTSVRISDHRSIENQELSLAMSTNYELDLSDTHIKPKSGSLL